MMTRKISERDSTEELLNTFRLFDDDGTGKISFKNLKRVAKGPFQISSDALMPGMVLSRLAPFIFPIFFLAEIGETISDEELREMIKEADTDGDDEISEAEFLRVMQKSGR